jgi:hypothetical protein
VAGLPKIDGWRIQSLPSWISPWAGGIAKGGKEKEELSEKQLKTGRVTWKF